MKRSKDYSISLRTPSRQQGSPSPKRRRVKKEDSDVIEKDYFMIKYIEWFLLEPTATRFLRGPVSVSVFPSIRGRGFILFGDKHTTLPAGTCSKRSEGGSEEIKSKKINLVLDSIFREKLSNGYMHDFFFEHTYIKADPVVTASSKDEDADIHWRGDQYKDTPIHTISNQFASCFRIDKKACKDVFPSVRFHYVDYRFGYMKGEKKERVRPSSFLMWALRSYEQQIKVIQSPAGKLSSSYKDFLIFVTPYAFGEGILRKFLREFYDLKAQSKSVSFKEYLSDFIGRVSGGGEEENDPAVFIFKERFERMSITHGGGAKCLEEYDPTYRQKMIRSIYSSPLSGEIVSFAVEKIAETYLKEFEKIVDNEEVLRLVARILKMAAPTPDLSSSSTVTFTRDDYDLLFANVIRARAILIKISAVYEFDIPTTCRMFKPSLVYQGSRFVWLYAGDIHTQHIVKIVSHLAIESIGDSAFPLVDVAPENDRKCIIMPYYE